MQHGPRLFVPWVLFAALCTALMWWMPGNETVPYHVAWIAVALAYGWEAWPWGRAVIGIAAYTLATGAVLVARAASGVIAWQETSEIPLMSALMLLVVWHVRRRHVAFGELVAMAEADRSRAANRERLSAMTSHEMRTPATIASGYTDLLLRDETDAQRRADLEVVREELGRLVLASDRLVRMLRMQEQHQFRELDLDQMLRETVERWSVLADRRWDVSTHLGRRVCAPERLRACLDTLLENALRYTDVGDTVRIVGSLVDDRVLVGVEDSGPGMDELLLRALTDHQPLPPADHYFAPDPKARTGFGLALVREAATDLGGRVVAGKSALGGALVLVSIPEAAAASAPPRLAVSHQVAPPQPHRDGAVS